MDEIRCGKPVIGVRCCQCCWLFLGLIFGIIRVAMISGWESNKKWYAFHDHHDAVPVCDIIKPPLCPAQQRDCSYWFASEEKVYCKTGTAAKCFFARPGEDEFDDVISHGDCTGKRGWGQGPGTTGLATILDNADNELAFDVCTAMGAKFCHMGLWRTSSSSSWQWKHSSAAVTYKNFNDGEDDEKDDHNSAGWVTKKGMDEVKGWFTFFALIGLGVGIIFLIVIGIDFGANYKGIKDKNKCCIICAMSGDIVLLVFYLIFLALNFLGGGRGSGPGRGAFVELIFNVIAMILFITSLSMTCMQCCNWVEGAPTGGTVNGMPVGQPMEVIGAVMNNEVNANNEMK